MIVAYINMQDFYINELYTLHTTGRYSIFLRNFVDRKVKVDETISILTVSNNLDKSYLCKQLANSNVSFKNCFDGFFENSCKIDCYTKLLENTDTEYALLCDAFDAVIMKDLDKTFIDKYKEFNKDILFSTDNIGYPRVNIKDCENDITYFINSGVIFGKTKSLYELFKNVLEFKKLHYEEEPKELRKSDQYWIRYYLITLDKNSIPSYTLDTSMKLCATHVYPKLVGKDKLTSTTYVNSRDSAKI